MCGLVGVLSNSKHGFSNIELDVFDNNLFINQLRGWDSTGVFSVNNAGKTDWLKVVGDVSDLWEHDHWDKNKDSIRKKLFQNGVAAIGHGRSATRGKVNEDNAHPFEVAREDGSKIVFVHNGTLSDYQNLPGLKDFDVDSHWLARQIAKLGPEEALGRVNGAMAVIWWDSQDDSLNIFRNNERPLHMIRATTRKNHKEADTIIINSVADPLKWLMDRHRLYSPSDQGIQFFTEMMWYKMPRSQIFGEWILKKIERKVVAFQNQNFPPVRNVTHYATFEDDEGEYGDDSLAAYYREINERRQQQLLGDKKVSDKFTDDERSFWIDALRILEGDFVEVSFQKKAGTRLTQYKSRIWSPSPCPPYIEGLVSMFLSKHSNEMVSFTTVDQEGSITTQHYSRVQIVAELEKSYPARFAAPPAAKPKVIINPTDHIDIGIKSFRPGNRINWQTVATDKTVMRHIAIVGKDPLPKFREYANADDGPLKFGDEVTIEVGSMKEAAKLKDGRAVMHCRGTRLRAVGEDKYVQFYWFDQSGDDEKVIYKQIYRGTITGMSLATVERARMNGIQVEVALGNVRPVDINEAISVMENMKTGGEGAAC
jgi:hypothetical protein